MDLSVIIVNYKTPQLTLSCIQSIYGTVKNIKYEIIVVDNNSEDDSKKIIKSKYPQINWISNNCNEGFGRANNIAIKISNGDYILFLNSDIIISSNTIQQCLRKINEDKAIGVLGCELRNDDDSVQKSYYYDAASFKSLIINNIFINYFWGNRKITVNAIMGAFMLIPRFVLDKVGHFDPDYFMYSEEIDLCIRIKKAGYRIEYFNEVCAYHKHEGSQTNKKMNLRQRFLSNALLYYKVHGHLGFFLYNLIFIFNIATNFILMLFLNRSYRREYRKEFYETAYGYFSNLFRYLIIPVFYNRRIGDGKRMLQVK